MERIRKALRYPVMQEAAPEHAPNWPRPGCMPGEESQSAAHGLQSKSLAGLLFLSVFLLLISGCLKQQVVHRGGHPHHLEEGMVSLNFDDGYESVYQNAVPLLKRAGIPASFYIITSTYKKNAPSYMKRQEILDLAAQGHEIGVHTRTHPHLPEIPPEKAVVEIRGARDDLKDLGIHARTFAYPYGEYNESIVRDVEQLGFSGARTTRGSFNDRNTNPFLLRLYDVQARTSIDDIKREVDAALDQKVWLILLFHKVEDSDEQYNIRPDVFKTLVEYLVSRRVKMVTTYEGLRLTGKAP